MLVVAVVIVVMDAVVVVRVLVVVVVMTAVLATVTDVQEAVGIQHVHICNMSWQKDA